MSKVYKVKPVPDGYRRLKLVHLEPIPPNTIGVYGLFFDNHFYIGKSVDVKVRIRKHLWQINTLLSQTLHGWDVKSMGAYTLIVDHLIKNKHIDTIEAALLYDTYTDEDAIREEWSWLHFLQGHPFGVLCLNKFDFFCRQNL